MSASSLFEHYNARSMTPAEVASTFVPPPAFPELAQPTHTVLVGPRGSGKTTLLQMLQTTALEYWDHPDAPTYRALVNYTAVFIPTDRNWDRQLRALSDSGMTETQRHLLTTAAFTAHVLWSVVDAGEGRLENNQGAAPWPHRRVRLSKEDEARLVGEVASSWDLDPTLPSLQSLRASLRRRMSDVYAFSVRERLLGAEGRDERFAAEPAFLQNYQDAAALFIELFNAAVGDPEGRWGLLFDELEFAPSLIRDQLLEALRSTNPRFIFKLSLSPYSPEDDLVQNLHAAMSGHDFSTISLSYGRKEDGYAFADALVANLLTRNGRDESPRHLFGSSGYSVEDPDDEDTPSVTDVLRRFESLQAKDPTFAAHLRRRKITIATLRDMPEHRRAAELRKIGPLVVTRDEFRRSPADRGYERRKTRSVQVPGIYSGDRALYAMLESNPRYLIAVVSRLLHSHPDSDRIPRSAQVNEVRVVRNRFRALLATIPLRDARGKVQRRGVLAVLDAVGDFFNRAVIQGPFTPDPPETFTIDGEVRDEVVASLGAALNAGAIVYVPDEGQEPSPNRIRNNRYRLSYMFAPQYRLPIRLGRSRALGQILDRSRPEQPELPDLTLGEENDVDDG